MGNKSKCLPVLRKMEESTCLQEEGGPLCLACKVQDSEGSKLLCRPLHSTAPTNGLWAVFNPWDAKHNEVGF